MYCVCVCVCVCVRACVHVCWWLTGPQCVVQPQAAGTPASRRRPLPMLGGRNSLWSISSCHGISSPSRISPAGKIPKNWGGRLRGNDHWKGAVYTCVCVCECVCVCICVCRRGVMARTGWTNTAVSCQARAAGQWAMPPPSSTPPPVRAGRAQEWCGARRTLAAGKRRLKGPTNTLCS